MKLIFLDQKLRIILWWARRLQERAEVNFPWERLDGRPLVYASFGTIRNKIDELYLAVIESFKELTHLQLILSKGAWNGNGFETLNLPENIITVDFAPQLEILKKAALCITHAGLRNYS
jgi:zeaxanthin glucosyltransferase